MIEYAQLQREDQELRLKVVTLTAENERLLQDKERYQQSASGAVLERDTYIQQIEDLESELEQLKTKLEQTKATTHEFESLQNELEKERMVNLQLWAKSGQQSGTCSGNMQTQDILSSSQEIENLNAEIRTLRQELQAQTVKTETLRQELDASTVKTKTLKQELDASTVKTQTMYKGLVLLNKIMENKIIELDHSKKVLLSRTIHSQAQVEIDQLARYGSGLVLNYRQYLQQIEAQNGLNIQ